MKTGVYVGLGVVAASFIVYFFGPKRVEYRERIVEKKVIQEVERLVENVIVHEHETRRPDGTVEITKTTTVDRSKDRASTTKAEKSQEVTKKIKPQAATTIYGGLGLTVNGSRSYAVGVQRDILGPVGIFGMGTFNERAGLGGFMGLSLRF